MIRVDRRTVDRRLDRLTSAVRGAGVKLTHQRLEIFREVASSLEHPDADAVFRAVRKRVPTVSIDTVYRTLWMLNDLGLITTLGPRRESVRFDANLEHHHHYVCVRCGLARDFESAELDALGVPDAVKALGRVVQTHVEVRGVCSRCAATEKTVNRRRPALGARSGGIEHDSNEVGTHEQRRRTGARCPREWTVKRIPRTDSRAATPR